MHLEAMLQSPTCLALTDLRVQSRKTNMSLVLVSATIDKICTGTCLAILANSQAAGIAPVRSTVTCRSEASQASNRTSSGRTHRPWPL